MISSSNSLPVRFDISHTNVPRPSLERYLDTLAEFSRMLRPLVRLHLRFRRKPRQSPGVCNSLLAVVSIDLHATGSAPVTAHYGPLNGLLPLLAPINLTAAKSRAVFSKSLLRVMLQQVPFC